MIERIEEIKRIFDMDVQRAANGPDLEAVRTKYLGRKGELAEITKVIPTLPNEEKKAFGQAVNELKNHIQTVLSEKEKSAGGSDDSREGIDVTMDGVKIKTGNLHPLTKTLDGITEIFVSLGFMVAEGPEIENEFANFEALNIPLDHPARDSFDTFYVDKNALLRSHTSTVQIRLMEKAKPPIQAIMPGRVYRPDAVDATHSFMFHQVEGLMIDKGIKFSDLKGVLNLFAKRMFGPEVKLRFRPSFFPFTEPSAEVDISCIICGGKGCRVCSNSGWLEILGAGMVNPKVFKNVGYDANKYTGFAFGMGVERIAMLKYGINDIRLFYENDVRFLEQF